MAMAGRLLKTHLAVDDNGIMLLRYPHVLCRLEMTWTEAVAHRPPHDLVVYGSEGTVVAGQEVWLDTRRQPEGRRVPPDPLPRSQTGALEHFVGCVRRGEDPAGMTSPDLSRQAQ
jgi:hypothetical protein